MLWREMPESNYNLSSRLLHHFALNYRFMLEASFQLEQSLYGDNLTDRHLESHVFISGLARAGTTILMRSLHETNLFRSLTYRDMPYVLAPNLWYRLSRYFARTSSDQMRAHQDNIMVNYDSPEALDEVFWRLHCEDIYLLPDCLVPMQANQEVIDSLRTYINLILKQHPNKRYLSKNNNNILRLPSLAKAFPNSVILLPVRNPLTHAFSLLRQHNRFCQVQKSNGFTCKYMQWLAHYEFGMDQRPFRFDTDESHNYSPSQMNYWLRLWISTYRFVSQSMTPNSILVSYEKLCNDTEATWRRLCDRIECEDFVKPPNLVESSPIIETEYSDELAQQALTIHDEIMNHVI